MSYHTPTPSAWARQSLGLVMLQSFHTHFSAATSKLALPHLPVQPTPPHILGQDSTPYYDHLFATNRPPVGLVDL